MLTALEDFVKGREDLQLAVVPAFFGFGVLWQRDAPWAGEVAAIIEPWDRNPVLARLEAERIFDLCTRIGKERQLGAARARIAVQEKLLQELLDSSAFALGDRLSRFRGGGRAASWRQRVSEILAEAEDPGEKAKGKKAQAELLFRRRRPRTWAMRRRGAVRRQLALCLTLSSSRCSSRARASESSCAAVA